MDRESAKYLSKLVNKFGRAINKSQGGVKISQLGREDEEKGAEVENERYSFAGKKARIANRKTLEKAERMLAEGIDTETIRKETGWFKGYDGKWRFEIDDSQMVIKDNVSNYTDLENLIEHDVLFEAYPELKKVGVIFCDLGESRSGYIDGEYFIPVRFGLKHGRGGENTLYVIIDQNKIEAEVVKLAPPQKMSSSNPLSASVVSVSQIIPYVNNKDILRYLPYADATSSAEKPLDTTELGALNQILHHMNFVFESYGKILRGGRWAIKRLSRFAIALNNYSFSTDKLTFSPLMSQAFAFAPSCA